MMPLKSQSLQTMLPTTARTIPFILAVWKARNVYSPLERQGFSMLWYSVLASCLEHMLIHLVQTRLFTLQQILGNANGSFPFTTPGIQVILDMTDYRQYLNQLILDESVKCGSKSMNDLTGVYAKIYGCSIKSNIGDDLYMDFDALSEMRNHFAHGKDIVVSLFWSSWEADISTCSLKKAIRRIIDLKIAPMPEHNAYEILFDDDVMLHFYKSTFNIQTQLYSLANPLEQGFSLGNILPDPKTLVPDHDTLS